MKIFACLPAVLLGLASFAAYADGTEGRDIRPGTVTGLEGSFLLPLQEESLLMTITAFLIPKKLCFSAVISLKPFTL